MHQRNYVKKQGYCLICGCDLNENVSFSNLFSLNNIVCVSCNNKFKIINKITFIKNVETLIIYEYNDFFKNLLYQYKGVYDIALCQVFLNNIKHKIKRKYKGYTLIFPPSNDNENKKRGFKHILEIINCLNMKTEDLFYKKIDYKQSNQKYEDRINIKNVIALNRKKSITNKKYLIVDDVITSGNTIATIIDILIKNKVDINNIKVLILSKKSDNVEL